MDIVKAITENGILVVIAGVFLYTYIVDRKANKERDSMFNASLQLLSEGNQNIAKILDLLNINACNNDKLLREHDARSIIMNERILELKNASEVRERKQVRKENKELKEEQEREENNL